MDTAEAAVGRALLGYGPVCSSGPVGAAVLRHRVEAAWTSWQTAGDRFTQAAVTLPTLVADVEHAVRAARAGTDEVERRAVLRSAADLYCLLRSYLRRTGRVDLAPLAADRAVRAAEDADDPLRIAAAQWKLGHVLLAAGQPVEAEELALRAAEQVAVAQMPEVERTAMGGALQLVAVVGAARRRRWWEARERLRERASPAARAVPDSSNIAWTVFGPTNVALHALSINRRTDVSRGRSSAAPTPAPVRLRDPLPTGTASRSSSTARCPGVSMPRRLSHSRWFAASRTDATSRATVVILDSSTRRSRSHPTAASNSAFGPSPVVRAGASPTPAPRARPRRTPGTPAAAAALAHGPAGCSPARCTP